MKPFRSWTALLVIASALATGMACETESPVAPSPTPTPSPPTGPPAGQVFVRVDGAAIDPDTEQPIAGASITTHRVSIPPRPPDIFYRTVTPNYPSSTLAGGDGRFALNAIAPPDWLSLEFEVASPGYETAVVSAIPTPGSETTLRAYRTVTIKAGETADLVVSLAHYACGWESHRCRRIVVDAPAGEFVDLEAISSDGRQGVFGLLVGTSEPWPDKDYHARVTAPAGPVWILGGGAPPVRMMLVARRR